MSTQSTLATFVAEHQSRENELRRLQNCLAAETQRAFVGLVDTSWCDLGADYDPDLISHGVVPISDQVQSNWAMGNDVPFALDPTLRSKIESSGNEVRYVWITFKSTSEDSFLFTHPDGERRSIQWGDTGTSHLGSYLFRAFTTEQEAQEWVDERLARMTA